MTPQEQAALLEILKKRFEQNRHRHPDLDWLTVQARLDAAVSEQWQSLAAMEASGGEPDVVGQDAGTGALLFVDCAAETPKGRRSLCYDREALESRKEHKPASSAIDLAQAMGVELLTEDQYRHLQSLEAFDTKTSSWLKTPDAVRQLGGALFGDRRYDRVFIYHNGAQSYYGVRGFRALLKV